MTPLCLFKRLLDALNNQLVREGLRAHVDPSTINPAEYLLFLFDSCLQYRQDASPRASRPQFEPIYQCFVFFQAALPDVGILLVDVKVRAVVFQVSLDGAQPLFRRIRRLRLPHVSSSFVEPLAVLANVPDSRERRSVGKEREIAKLLEALYELRVDLVLMPRPKVSFAHAIDGEERVHAMRAEPGLLKIERCLLTTVTTVTTFLRHHRCGLEFTVHLGEGEGEGEGVD